MTVARLAEGRRGFLVRLGLGTPMRTHEAKWGYIFALPWVVGLVVFVAGPVLASMYLSFHDYDIVSSPRFIGLAQYKKALFGDPLFWGSVGKTLYFALVSVPLTLVGSFLAAVLLNQKLVGTNIFRTCFFLPHLTPAVVMAILWVYFLHPRMGPVNYYLGALGLPQPQWLQSKTMAIPSIILISTWSGIGSNRMLIFLAGLQGVPQHLLDSAQIDGAGIWDRFRHITIPMVSPLIFFNLILGIIGALHIFSLAFIATNGGPSYATWFYALHIYKQSFMYFRMGYGCALAWFYALFLIALTLLQVKLSGRWVYYEGGR